MNLKKIDVTFRRIATILYQSQTIIVFKYQIV